MTVAAAQIVDADRFAGPTKAESNRLLKNFGAWGLEHKAGIRYQEVRPIPQVKPLKFPPLPFTTDCSGFVTMAYQYAGCPDPNGTGYDNGRTRPSYTGTLLTHNDHVGIHHVTPGDLVVFGCLTYPDGHHIALVVAVHDDPATPHGIMLVSHGQEGDPVLKRVSAEARLQPDGLDGVIYLKPRR